MFSLSPSPQTRLLSTAHRRTSLFFIFLTIILHFLFFQSANLTTFKSQSTSTPSEKNIHVHLQTLSAPKPDHAISNANIAKPLVKATPHHPPAIHPTSQALAEFSIPITSIEEIAIAPPIPTSETLVQASTEPEELTLRILNSADLSLEINRTNVNGSTQHGVGKMIWRVGDEKYALSIEVGLNMLVTTLPLYKISSNGHLSPYGLSPHITSETRLARPETATHFNYEQNTVSFSASTQSVPMEIGIQDKASVLLQLASIGNADASQLTVGRELLVQVAEEKEASIFSFIVIGEEDIDSVLGVDNGQLKTIHITRPPKLGAYHSKLDIWLAPSLGWYPIQIRNTESNGSVTTQKVTHIQQTQQTQQTD